MLPRARGSKLDELVVLTIGRGLLQPARNVPLPMSEDDLLELLSNLAFSLHDF